MNAHVLGRPLGRAPCKHDLRVAVPVESVVCYATFVFSSGLEIPSRNRSYFRTSWRGREGAPRCFFIVTVSNKKILEEYKLAKILASISFYSSYYITLYYTCFCRTMYTSLNNRCLSDSICEHDPAWLVNGTMVQRFHI